MVDSVCRNIVAGIDWLMNWYWWVYLSLTFRFLLLVCYYYLMTNKSRMIFSNEELSYLYYQLERISNCLRIVIFQHSYEMMHATKNWWQRDGLWSTVNKTQCIYHLKRIHVIIGMTTLKKRGLGKTSSSQSSLRRTVYLFLCETVIPIHIHEDYHVDNKGLSD